MNMQSMTFVKTFKEKFM